MSGIVRRLEWDQQPQSAVPIADSRGTASTPVNLSNVVGTPTASVVAKSAGRFGPAKAWATDGAATYLELAQSAGNFGTGPFSVTLVFRSNATVASSSGVLGNNQNGTAGGWLLYAASTTTLRINTDAGFSTTLDCGVNVFDGVWHVVTLTRNSAGTYRFIVDGIADASATVAVFDVDQARTVIAGAQKQLSNVSRFSPFDFALIDLRKRAFSVPEAIKIHHNPWQLFEPEQVNVPFAGGATDYPVTATDALTLADSASQAFAATGVAADALTLADSASNVASLGAAGSDALSLADSVSNVAALSATATDALSLADSASNVAALSATASDAMTLADTLNATASGDYTAIGSDALTLADSATNVASLGATGSDALTLADAASNVAALGATASDALTLADTLNASASGDYVVVATDALSLSDSVVAAYAAICIATDALTLADATSAAMAGQYAATATDALVLADAVSNAAALGVSISEALTLAALVSALNSGFTLGEPSLTVRAELREWAVQAAGTMTIRVRGNQ